MEGARVLHDSVCQKRKVLEALCISRSNNINKRLENIVWAGPAATFSAPKFMGRRYRINQQPRFGLSSAPSPYYPY